MLKHLPLLAVLFAVPGRADSPVVLPDAEQPTDAVLQEMHDLRAERTRLRIHHPETHPRFAEIAERLKAIHEDELGQWERVTTHAGLDCSEEPKFGQPSYGIILYATATRKIEADELLLFHAGGVYRTIGSFRPLKTNGQGFYFRPNTDVPAGKKFVVACIQDAPEEIANVKNGFMPDSDRARNPKRPYDTEIFGRDGKPFPPPN